MADRRNESEDSHSDRWIYYPDTLEWELLANQFTVARSEQRAFGLHFVPGVLMPSASPVLKFFGVEFLMLASLSGMMILGTLRMRIFRFEQRVTANMIKEASLTGPLRPFIEQLFWPLHDVPRLVLLNTPPGQYEKVTASFAPGMRLMMNPGELASYARPGPQRDYPNRAEWQATLERACDAIEQAGDAATKERVAEYLERSTKTIERNCSRYFGKTWEVWKAGRDRG
jgi:hypothetical protein